MNPNEMKQRIKAFALRIIKAVMALPRSRIAEVLEKQLLQCDASVGTNDRADFSAKMGIVEKEADETIYGMKLLIEAGLVKASKLDFLMKEADELVALTVAPINTACGRPR